MKTKTATVRARMEPSIKRKAEAVFESIGISPSEAINVFYHRVLRDKGIPFSLNVPNANTRKAIEDVKRGRGTLMSLEEFVKETRRAEKKSF